MTAAGDYPIGVAATQLSNRNPCWTRDIQYLASDVRPGGPVRGRRGARDFTTPMCWMS